MFSSSENLAIYEHFRSRRLDGRGECKWKHSCASWNVGRRVGKKGILVVVYKVSLAKLPPPSMQHIEDEVVPRGKTKWTLALMDYSRQPSFSVTFMFHQQIVSARVHHSQAGGKV